MSGRTVIEPGVYHQDSGAVWVNLKIAQRTAGNGIDVWGDDDLLPAESLGKAPLIQFGSRIWQQLIERRPIDGVLRRRQVRVNRAEGRLCCKGHQYAR